MSAPTAPLCPIGDPRVLGIDISFLNGPVDMMAVKAAGYDLVIAREGENDWASADPLFAANWKAAHEADLVVGAYHVLHPDHDPIMQAKIARDRCVHFEPGRDFIANDFELHGGGHEPVRAAAFDDACRRLFGVVPIVYTGPGFLDAFGDGETTPLADSPLWVAHYGVSSPRVPRAWKAKGWAIWQWKGDHGGAVPGVPQSGDNIDHNVWRGTFGELRFFVESLRIAPAVEGRPSGIDASLEAAASLTPGAYDDAT